MVASGGAEALTKPWRGRVCSSGEQSMCYSIYILSYTLRLYRTVTPELHNSIHTPLTINNSNIVPTLQPHSLYVLLS